MDSTGQMCITSYFISCNYNCNNTKTSIVGQTITIRKALITQQYQHSVPKNEIQHIAQTFFTLYPQSEDIRKSELLRPQNILANECSNSMSLVIYNK